MNALQATLAACAACATMAVHAADSFTLSGGPSSDADGIRVAAGWDWNKRWFSDGDWHLGGYWEANLGYWQGREAGARNLWSLGVTPVFRLAANDRQHSRWFWDFGVGLQVQSDDHVNTERQLGSRVLFSDVLGVGRTFGDKDRHELGYRFWHLSNANLADENDGLSFHEIRWTWRFDKP
jgi:hypothetical protein